MQNIQLLYEKYLNGECSAQEIHLLMDHFDVEGDRSILSQKIEEVVEQVESRVTDTPDISAILARNHKSVMKAVGRKENSISLYVKILTAAAITLVIGYIFLVMTGKLKTVPPPVHSTTVIKVLPGGNRAKLKLSDGRIIDLIGASSGELANDQGAVIKQIADGQISYTLSNNPSLSSLYNSIITPRGGQYTVLLPDGSKVWLNAASSLKYPVSFAGLKERRIELEGEAYFEVAKDKLHPFTVRTREQEVTVLGTHFNINSYQDEQKVVTTLEEGRVKVISGNLTLNLSPGERTVLSSEGNMEIQHADLETALAWKNGKIYFKDADIKSIMRQVARWYNVDVAFEGKLPGKLYSGGIYRTANLSNLLDILEESNIHFKLTEPSKGKKLLTVYP